MKQDERFALMRKESEMKIKSAATKLFANNTLAKTTIADIAREAGVSTGLAYRYFGSKQEIFDAIISDAISGLKNLTSIFQNTGDPKQILVQATQQLLTSHEDNPESIEISMLMMQTLFPRNDENVKLKELLTVDERLIDTIATLIHKGQEIGDFKSGDPHDMATFYLAQYQGVTFMAATLDDFKMPTAEMFLAFVLQ